MSDDTKNIDELTDDSSSSKKVGESSSEIPKNPYSGIKRLLSEEDLDNIAIKKLIISENDKLERQISELEKIKTKYHEIDKEKAVLEEKVAKRNSFEILYSFCLSVGSVLAGLSGIFWEQKGYLLLILGIVLIIGGIIAKIAKK